MKAVVVIIVFLFGCSLGLNNGLGKTPQMGWNSWNKFACNVNETVVRQTIDAFISSGLSRYGYNYVNVDDCWAASRTSDGTVVSDPTTFPSGMKALADYAHSKGLKFGLYSDAGYKTCAGRPGSLGYESIDAKTYASWNVDYLKYDNCNTDGSKPEVRYPVMRDALNQTGRQIFFSMCEWGVDNPATWAPSVGNSWRTTGDISDNWNSMTLNLDLNEALYPYAAPGGWNDPDMLEIGNGGMTFDEYKSHFSLWSLMKAPLLIGCDVRSLSSQTFSILTATEVIAVNQDPLGVQGHRVSQSGGLEVWAGPLQGGSVAVVLFNRNSQSASITATWTAIGLNHDINASVRDLWAGQNLGNFRAKFSATVNPHGVVMVKVSPL
jgi:alpha-galactosidase